jgi:hypothetical protein
VEVEDSLGNVVTTDTSNVTVAIGTNPSAGTLSGTTTVAAVAGTATFSTLAINKAGNGYTLTAADGTLTTATSSAFNIVTTIGVPTQLVFGVQPSNTTAGATISPAVTVKVEDSNGNVVTTDTSNVTLAIGTNPGGGTLSGTVTVAAVSGIATFSTLSINKAGVGYTLTGADGTLTHATSSAFNITPGTSTQVVFGVQPSNTTAGATIAPAVTVLVEDSLGNVVTTDTSNVTVAIGTNPSAGTLSGTTTVAAVGGTATFSTLSINKTGTGYTLTAADDSLTKATSSAFNITAGSATQLVFGVQPTNTTAGATISPAVTVKVEDSLGNVVTTDSSNVTVAIGTNPGGGTLSGTTTVAAVGGTATFSTLSIDKTGIGYTLTAADGTLTHATSSAFNITPGAAFGVDFNQQPTNTTAGATISPAVTVDVVDSLGNVVTTDTSNVTVAIGTNPGGGTLSGTATVAAVGGTATFSTLSINKTGTGYTLTASDGTLTHDTSAPFNIVAGSATQLVFGVQPSNTGVGATISPAVTVKVEDSLGNVVSTDSSNVTVAIGTNPSGGTLSGTTTVAAVSGTATFSTLSIDKAGNGYTLTAADGPLTHATSSAFNITSASAVKLVFTTQPTNTVAGVTIAPAVTVVVEDSAGNVITTDNSNVTVAIGTNPGSGTLSGTATVAAVSGVATFSTLSINKAGVGYTLTAADGSLTGATSVTFNITPGSATHLVFGVQPSDSMPNATIAPAVTVQVEDSLGNVVTTNSSNVTVAIGTNPGGGTLSGTTTVAAVAGTATFSNLSIDKAGNGYTLTAADGSLTGATSNPFNIAANGIDSNGNLVVNGVPGQGNVIIVNSNAHTFSINGQTQSYNAVALTGHIIINGVGNIANSIQVTGSVSAEIHAGNGNDTITGGSGDDVIYGGAGNDVIQGGGGNDVLISGTGRSRVTASSGHNILIGGSLAAGPLSTYAALNALAEEWAAGMNIDPQINALAAILSVLPTTQARLTGGTGPTGGTPPTSTNYFLGFTANTIITNFTPPGDKEKLI